MGKHLKQYRFSGPGQGLGRRYEAISYGGAKLFVMTTFIITFILLSVSGLIFGPYSKVDIGWFQFSVAITGFTAALLVIFFTNASPIEWLRNYWRLNVKGHTESFYFFYYNGRNFVSDIGGRDGHAPEGMFALNAPLGGWFNWPRVVLNAVDVTDELGIKIKMVAGGYAHVVDSNGAGVSLDIETALELFEDYLKHLHIFSSKSVRNVFDWNGSVTKMVNKIQILLKEKAEREKTLVGLKEQHQALINHSEIDKLSALATMEDAISSIEKTSRFIKSRDAMRIRLNLIRGSFDLMTADDPRRKRYLEMLDAESKKPAKRAS